MGGGSTESYTGEGVKEKFAKELSEVPQIDTLLVNSFGEETVAGRMVPGVASGLEARRGVAPALERGRERSDSAGLEDMQRHRRDGDYSGAAVKQPTRER